MNILSNFIVEFLLKTEKYQEDILDKRFEIGRNIYNSLVNVTYKRYKEMIKTKEYRKLISLLTNNKKANKKIWQQINNLKKQYNISEYSFYNDVKKMQKHFKSNIDSLTARKIATRLWESYNKMFLENNSKIHYKKYNEFNTLEGKTNKTGIRFKDNMLVWNKLKIPICINYNNLYEFQSLKNDICYCRIIRKYIRNKYKYYVQIIFKGTPPVKVNIKTGKIRYPIKHGDVGLDIGPSTIAIASESDVKILELADKVQNIENQKKNY
nr:MAG TPA: hypothetical protein [Bacteriophage sp.]